MRNKILMRAGDSKRRIKSQWPKQMLTMVQTPSSLPNSAYIICEHSLTSERGLLFFLCVLLCIPFSSSPFWTSPAPWPMVFKSCPSLPCVTPLLLGTWKIPSTMTYTVEPRFTYTSVYGCFGLRTVICRKCCLGLRTKFRFTYAHLRNSDFSKLGSPARVYESSTGARIF